MPGIEKTLIAVRAVASIVNQEEILRSLDWKALLDEVWDMDEAEVTQVAMELQMLDLNDDQIEEMIKQGALKYGYYFAFLLKLIHMLLPKKA